MEKTLKDAIIEGAKSLYFQRKTDNAVIKVYSLETCCKEPFSIPKFKAFEVKFLRNDDYVPKGHIPFEIPLIEPELNKYRVISYEEAKKFLSAEI
ncbi:MAG: hypothetical protein N3G19_00125 [Candidatus Pacearchaeota archaeon]|nr:hypothetical protein [Candidatus Pacearchaeota archaeon]